MSRAAPGEAAAVFAALLRVDTDECVPWPFHKNGGGGYGQLGRDGRMRRVHVLACEHWHGPKPTPDHEAAHSCNNRACMNGRLLRWATKSENAIDSVLAGTHRSARLTELDVLRIRARLAAGESQASVARAYGVARRTVSHIATGRHWGWVA